MAAGGHGRHGSRWPSYPFRSLNGRVCCCAHAAKITVAFSPPQMVYRGAIGHGGLSALILIRTVVPPAVAKTTSTCSPPPNFRWCTGAPWVAVTFLPSLLPECLCLLLWLKILFPPSPCPPPQMVYMGAMGHGGLPLSVTSSYIILLLYMLAVVINLSVRDWMPMWDIVCLGCM